MTQRRDHVQCIEKRASSARNCPEACPCPFKKMYTVLFSKQEQNITKNLVVLPVEKEDASTQKMMWSSPCGCLNPRQELIINTHTAKLT